MPKKRAYQARSKLVIVSLLLSMLLLGVFPLDVILPSFPALSVHFQSSAQDIALTLSLFAVGVALSQLVIGPLSDRLGRKRLLIVGLLISIIAAWGCTLTTSFEAFITLRIIQAIGCGCFVLTHALVQDMFDEGERVKVRILMTSASGLFISLSPLAGSYLQAWFDWQGSFYLFSLLALGVLGVSLRCIPRDVTASGRPLSFFNAYKQLLTNSRFIGYSSLAAIAFASHFAFIVMSPILFLDILQATPHAFAMALLFYGVAYLAGGSVAAALHHRLPHNFLLLAGLGMIGVAGLSIVLMPEQWFLSFAGILIPMTLCTFGITTVRPVATCRAIELYPTSAGATSAMLNTLVFITGGLVSALVSRYPAHIGVSLGSAFIGLSLVGALVVTALSARTKAVN
ncbi:MFS transporter [Pseudomonas sp. nanlin1]|uniref:MFS transporter n=1 Tax=Pseudomonas sp. nanlin1 TaxID=3040605 RepID=UPI00388EC5BA